MEAQISLAGLAAAISQSHATAEVIRQAVASGIYEEAELVMTDSKANYVPVDIGTLRDSGFVDLPEWEGDQVTCQMGFGGPAEDYALVQHERLDFHHAVGQAKFLEIPLLEAASGMDERLTAHVKNAIESGAA